MKQDNTLRTFEGAVAIVTGGASGIGRALAEALVRRGAQVVLADLQIDLAEATVAGMRSHGGKATAAELDVTDFPVMNRLVQDTLNACGRLDYMFNNAGISIGGEVRLYHIEDWYRVFDVNIRGVANGVQAAYPVMVNQLGVGSKCIESGGAVDSWHHHVEQDQVGSKPTRHLDRLSARLAHLDLGSTPGTQGDTDDGQDVGIVVDDENAL